LGGLPADLEPPLPIHYTWGAFRESGAFPLVEHNLRLALIRTVSMSGRSKRKSTEPASAKSVPQAVVSRLSYYLRELQHLLRQGVQTISSSQLGQRLGFTDAQVRKDLAYFGQFGYPGIGYRCQELAEAIRRILGTDQQWAVALVGVGHLGQALLGYKGFTQQGFVFHAAFDVNPRVIGKQIEGIPIYSLDRLPEVIRSHKIRLGIIAVPASAAQGVADRLVEAGIQGILNFAPVTITVPPQVSLVGVDLAMELEQLSFSVLHRQQDAGK